MTAEIIQFHPNPEEVLWKTVERHMDAFLEQGGPDLENGDIGRAVCLRLTHHIPNIQGAWAEARRVRAADEKVRA